MPNDTTATGTTSRGLPIQVTFRAARPPALSQLCICCPGMVLPAAPPRVVASHADLILLRVPINPDSVSCFMEEFWDYFLYRAHPARLDLLPNPYPIRFNDSDAALLSCQDDGYAVAALRSRIPRRDPSGGASMKPEFDLHLYRSSNADDGWITKRLSVEEPVRDRLVPLPKAVADIMPYHDTGKTITVGGERGTVAWVDLWRGIILCDVLVKFPLLRDVALPLPARGNWDYLLQECDPNYFRDITISLHKDFIKYIEVELRPPQEPENTTHRSYLEWVRQNRSNSLVCGDGWKATTWNLPIQDASWDNWRCECEVDVNDLNIKSSKPWFSKLLSNLQGSDTKAILQRLAYPTISMDDDAVYLLSKVGKLTLMVALDVKKKMLREVAELDTQKNFFLMPSFCSSEISMFLKKKTGALEALEPAEREGHKATKVHVKKMTSRMRHGNKQVWKRRPLNDAIQNQLV